MKDNRTTRIAYEQRDYKNRKPYRTKFQKIEARRLAKKCEDGAWRSTAPVSFHK